MPLFVMPQKKERKFPISREMKIVIDSGLIDESQVKKFAEFPELLEMEVENEQTYPDISVLEKDIFDAVLRNDYHKFFRCVARVGARADLLPRIYNWLIAKEDFDVKRDLPLLKRIEGAKSVFNIFDY